jgi:nucleotide-binding universal stress UspA family protein
MPSTSSTAVCTRGDEFVDGREGPEHTLEEQGAAALDTVTVRADSAGVNVTTTLVYATPSERLLAVADEHDVDTVVVGTRHRPNEYRSLFGSVAERTVRLAERPVVVVKTPTGA